MIRILIADDQEMIRQGFRLILDAQPDMQVVADAADGATALDLARRLRPDVIVADIRMPRMDGLALTRALAGPDVRDPMRVVVVTTFDLDEYVYTALRNGACGFLIKRAGPTLLVEAIRAAMAGDALISPSVTVRLLQHLRAGPQRDAASAPIEPLTHREIEVARLVAEGKTNVEVGAQLFIAPGTVKTHIANIQRKLDVRNRVGIAVWAWNSGHHPA
jgi:DNA-binding NarL/FixJ family response regulator